MSKIGFLLAQKPSDLTNIKTFILDKRFCVSEKSYQDLDKAFDEGRLYYMMACYREWYPEVVGVCALDEAYSPLVYLVIRGYDHKHYDQKFWDYITSEAKRFGAKGITVNCSDIDDYLSWMKKGFQSSDNNLSSCYIDFIDEKVVNI